MTEFLFPDNTVLCNFAAVDRLDLLESVLNGRGRWTEAVAHEATKSAYYVPALKGLLANCWLGEVIEISSEPDMQKIERIRRAVFGGTDDQPLKHLGEAQTCYVITNWVALAGSWWISDDREALRYARAQGITTRDTADLVSIAVGNGDIDAQDGLILLRQMADLGRKLRVPDSVTALHR
ncbi:MAG: hypothetical protein ACRDRG_17265 [Pseudonocardiaceae bacterium]